jgi:diguanylate cyclase (GGDEF)-like protein
MASAPPAGREMDPTLVRVALRYVERNLGAVAAARVARAAGLGNLDDLGLDADGTRWFSRAEVLALARAGARVCHDDDFGRRVGEELVRNSVSNGMLEMLRSDGNVEAALPGYLNAGSKMAITRSMRLVDTSPGNAVIEASFATAEEADPFFCGIVCGFYSTVPWIFGACGSVVEVACQCKGDDAGDVRAIVGSESIGRADPLIRRFEQLQDMATALATAEDMSTALELVAELSALVVSAPRHLLAVRTAPDEPLRVYQKGWDDPAEATAVAERLEAGDWQPNEAVVPVASEKGAYGVLAAIYSAASTAGEVEQRLLASYAKHAAAAIEAAVALESARRDRDTANALLSLARALGHVTTQPDVISTLAEVLPAVLDSDHVWLWTWNAGAECLELAATSFELPCGGLPVTLDAEELPGIRRLVLDPRPAFLEVGTERAPINQHLEATGTTWGAVVPILARGDFLGVIVSAYPERLSAGDEADLVDRMEGLAGQAATALDNARLLDRIRYQALRDPLTGLPNRPLMEDRANQALRAAARDGNDVGLLFVDLDRFKIVNDTLGHAAGDRLICRVADRIAESLRTSDTLARLGGDEFVVLLRHIDGIDAATLAAGRIVESLRAPFDFDGRRLFVSCSIGVAVSSEHGTTYAELLQHADAAMYEAKAQGKNTYETRANRVADRGRSLLDLEADLHLALERDELTVLYQPQIDFRTMKIVAVEALVRWDHHDLGRLGPDTFLPMAEESGLIVEIDRWVREMAVAQAVTWRDRGTPLRVAVNISTRDLHRPTLCAEVGELLERSGLEPKLLELEITDRVIMSEERLPAILADFRALGVRLAIDDFGTGTSVLGRLQRCPVDVLKIDKGFVQTITAANPDAPVVAALMSLAHQLGMEVVAEGVETAFQGGLLRRLGGHLAQGYFFSPPVDADAVDDLMRSPSERALEVRGHTGSRTTV